MIRKGLIALSVITLGAVFCFGKEAVSYISTTANKMRHSVRDAVPLDFEIDRARDMLKDLVPDIRRNMHLIAKEEVEIERLSKQIEQHEQRLEKDRADIMRLKGDLESGKTVFTYAHRDYTADQVKIDLANRFERYKTADATLDSLREMQRARQRSLDAAREKLEGMLAAKRRLEVDVEHLDARLKMVEAAQTTSEYQFDDSRLNRAKELVSDLRSRLDVAERMLNTETSFHGQIPLEPTAPEKIVDEVAEYFGSAPEARVAQADASRN